MASNHPSRFHVIVSETAVLKKFEVPVKPAPR